MKSKNLVKKKDVKIVLYKDKKEDFVSLLVTNRYYKSSIKIYHDNLSFENDFKSLSIKFQEDEWICELDIDRDELKKELESRHFLVIMGEDY
jgi:hypothetical protein